MIGMIAIEIFSSAVGNAAGRYWGNRRGGARRATLNGVAVDLDLALRNVASTTATLSEQTQALVNATCALRNCAALFDEKLELLIEASFKAGWVQLEYAAGAADEENMKWYLRQAASEFGRALGTLKNERLITAHFGAALAQLQLGELANGLQTLEAVRSISFDASDPKANFWTFARLKLEASDYLASLAGQTRFAAKQREYSQGFERRATALLNGPSRDQAFALARATRTLENDLQAGAEALRAAAFGPDVTLNTEAARIYQETFGVGIDWAISPLRLPQGTPVPRRASTSVLQRPASKAVASPLAPLASSNALSAASRVAQTSSPRVQSVPLPDVGAALSGAPAVCLLAANLVFLLLGVGLEIFAFGAQNSAAFCGNVVLLAAVVLVNNGVAVALRRSKNRFYAAVTAGVLGFAATEVGLICASAFELATEETLELCASAANVAGTAAFVVALSYWRRFDWGDALLSGALAALALFYSFGLKEGESESGLASGLTLLNALLTATLFAKSTRNLLSARVRRLSDKLIAGSAFLLYMLFYFEPTAKSSAERWEAFFAWTTLYVWTFSLYLKLQEGSVNNARRVR